MAAQPIRISVSATADAQGNAQIKRVLDNSRYLVLVFTGFTLGTGPGASWSMFLENDPVLFDLGSQVTLGPVLLNPMEQATINIAGLPAGAVVQGSFWGTAGDTPAEVLPYFVSPARGNVLAAQPDKALPGSPFTLTNGADVTITTTVDAAAHAIEIVAGPGFTIDLGAGSSVTVKGHTTGAVMDIAAVPSRGAPATSMGEIKLRVSPAVEEVIDIIFSSVTSLSGQIWVNEILTDEVVTVVGNAYGSPLAVKLTDASPAVTQQVIESHAPGSAASVALPGVTVAAGATELLVAQQPTQSIRVGQIYLQTAGPGTAGQAWQVRQAGGGVILFACLSTILTPAPRECGGVPLPAGTALELFNNTGGSLVFTGNVDYVQD